MLILPVGIVDRVTLLANERIERTWKENGWAEPPHLSAGIVQAVLSAYYDARYSFPIAEQLVVSPESSVAKT